MGKSLECFCRLFQTRRCSTRVCQRVYASSTKFVWFRFVEALGYEVDGEYDQWVFEEVDGTNQIGGYAAYYNNNTLSYVTVKVNFSKIG